MGVCNSMRDCINSKPPLAVFAASIAAFAFTLLGVSFYLQSHRSQILNPDIKDWNSFYLTLSDMEMCFPSDEKDDVKEKTRTRRELAPITDPPSDPVIKANETESNITVSVMADFHVELNNQVVRGKTLHAIIEAKFLGFRRDPSVLEITLELSKKVSKNWTACVMLSGPPHLLPNSPQMPPTCNISQNTKPVEVTMGQPWLMNYSEEWCSSDKVASLMVAPQHELDVYLTEGDVTLIQVHILYTTCLLCLMMVVLLFYFVCGKRCVLRPNTTHVQAADKVPLHP